MSPIFVRPVREQLEHDRLIRFLAAKYKRKSDVAMNVGDEQVAPIKIGTATFYPDLVLTSGRKLEGLVEVESGESVNNLEALAEWVPFAKARAPFHLYVPVPAYDTARRLCEANQARVAEIWTYRPTLDGFDLVRIFAETSPLARPAKAPTSPPEPKAARRAAAPPKPKPKGPKKAASKPRPRPAAAARKKGRAAPKKAAGARKR